MLLGEAQVTLVCEILLRTWITRDILCALIFVDSVLQWAGLFQVSPMWQLENAL